MEFLVSALNSNNCNLYLYCYLISIYYINVKVSRGTISIYKLSKCHEPKGATELVCVWGGAFVSVNIYNCNNIFTMLPWLENSPFKFWREHAVQILKGAYCSNFEGSLLFKFWREPTVQILKGAYCSNFEGSLLFKLWKGPTVQILKGAYCSNFEGSLLFKFWREATVQILKGACCSYLEGSLLFKFWREPAVQILKGACCSNFEGSLLFKFWREPAVQFLKGAYCAKLRKWTIEIYLNAHALENVIAVQGAFTSSNP